MSERWGKCRSCSGSGGKVEIDTCVKIECTSCDGTGFNGDSLEYLSQQLKSEWERDQLYEERYDW